MEIDAFMTRLGVALEMEYTDEQLEFAKDFTKPTLTFADPGTGKTATLIAGLLTAELYHHIPAENIIASSFTRLATMELDHKHQSACKKMNVKSKVQFRTWHGICSDIITKNAGVLGMHRLKTDAQMSVKDMSTFLIEAADEMGIEINPRNVRNIVFAIRSLNSALVFDRDHVESKIIFKRAKIKFEDFSRLRRMVYDTNKLMCKAPVDHILLYTLEILKREPKISEEYKKKCKLLVIDEFQDMSLLQIELARYISDNIVVVGDIKQQIYAFNGACQNIVSKFIEYFPDCRQIELTQSFRCGKKIAEYAKKVIYHNHLGGDHFKGTSEEGKVEIVKNADLQKICEDIADDFNTQKKFNKTVMFLFRNNFSVVPIADTFYKLGMPFRVKNYVPAHQIPVISDLCQIIELARNPSIPTNVDILRKVVPEFRGQDNIKSNPLYKIMTKKNMSFFDIDYEYRDFQVGTLLNSIMKDVKSMLKSYVPTREIFNRIWPFYATYYLEDNEYKLEQPAKYYTSLVAPLVQDKSYDEFTRDELDKIKKIKKCNETRTGVKCLTIHSAKGMEEDVIHLVDCDDGIFPNKKKIDDMLKAGCEIDAAREIQNERSLVFVGVTRARSELYIHYRNELSSLFTEANEFESLDRIREVADMDYLDVDVFDEFIRDDVG
jgi:DNA helicase-2/ATP-dependent DNA helicase PcrA